jgi:hypothetical protein
VHHAQRGEGIQAAAYGRAGNLRFLAELRNGQPLALGSKGVENLQPARQRQHKVRVVFGLPGAEGVGVSSLIEFLSVENKSSRASLYRGQKGRRLNVPVLPPDHIINLILTNASIIAQHFDYRR